MTYILNMASILEFDSHKGLMNLIYCNLLQKWFSNMFHNIITTFVWIYGGHLEIGGHLEYGGHIGICRFVGTDEPYFLNACTLSNNVLRKWPSNVFKNFLIKFWRPSWKAAAILNMGAILEFTAFKGLLRLTWWVCAPYQTIYCGNGSQMSFIPL